MAIRGLSFFAGGECFAVDAALVQKVVRRMSVTPVPAAPDGVAGIAGLGGMVVTVLSVPALLGRAREESRGGPRAADVVVFKASVCGGDPMGFLAERPGDLLEIGEAETAPPSGADEGLPVAGVFEPGGMPCRIIDVGAVVSRFRNGGRAAAAGGESR